EFGDFSTIIAATASSFNSGSDAGTSFKTFLGGLTPETKAARKAFAELGITAKDGSNRFFDAAGNLKSMAEVTQILHDATANLTEEQKSQALTTIFGTDAMRMAGAISQLTGEQIATMNQTMKDTSAADVAAVRMGNLKGSMEALKGSIEVIQIEIGTKLLPVLTKFASWAATELPVAFAYFETEIAPKIKATFEDISAAVERFVTIARPYIVAFATEAGEQFRKFQGYYETDLKPAFDNIVTAVRYVVDVFRDNFDKIKPLVQFLADYIKAAVMIIVNHFQILIDLLSGDWAGAWQNTKEMVKAAADAWVSALKAAAQAIRLLVAVLRDIGEDLMNGLLDGLNAGGPVVWAWLKDLGLAVVRFVGDTSRTLYDAGWNLVSGFFSGIMDKFRSGIGGITNALDPRNWDIPGLSPLPQAMEHAGQITGSMFGESFTRNVESSVEKGASAIAAAVKDAALLASAFTPGGVAPQWDPTQNKWVPIGRTQETFGGQTKSQLEAAGNALARSGGNLAGVPGHNWDWTPGSGWGLQSIQGTEQDPWAFDRLNPATGRRERGQINPATGYPVTVNVYATGYVQDVGALTREIERELRRSVA
ncbi:MAG: phage tail tape measure protein, partial [Anaerolinea sp.]|nr:phage tail tape measure protein [Anaerolinea sp.]